MRLRELIHALAPTLRQVSTEQIAVGNAAAVAVAGNVDRIVHRSDVALAVAERIQAFNGLSFGIKALEIYVGLQAARNRKQCGTDLERIERAFFDRRQEHGLFVMMSVSSPPRTCRCSAQPWP